MPLLVDRRNFLKASLAVAAMPWLERMATATQKTELRWALLSDIHIAADAGDTYRGFHPHENLKKVLGEVGGQPFDAMVINGDIARLEGKPADYEAVTGYLDPITQKIPLAITLGNHDDRKNCRSAFASLNGEVQPVEKKFVTTLDAGLIEFLFLDSLMATNIAPGQLGKAQRDWLSSYLRTATKPIVIFVHHDPDPDDDNGLLDATRFLDLAGEHQAVKAILFGHTHAWRHETVKGLHLINIPAVAYNFKDSEPIGWTDAHFTSTGAALKLNAIGGKMTANGETLPLRWR